MSQPSHCKELERRQADTYPPEMLHGVLGKPAAKDGGQCCSPGTLTESRYDTHAPHGRPG